MEFVPMINGFLPMRRRIHSAFISIITRYPPS